MEAIHACSSDVLVCEGEALPPPEPTLADRVVMLAGKFETQKELAAYLGCSTAFVSMVLSGARGRRRLNKSRAALMEENASLRRQLAVLRREASRARFGRWKESA